MNATFFEVFHLSWFTMRDKILEVIIEKPNKQTKHEKQDYQIMTDYDYHYHYLRPLGANFLPQNSTFRDFELLKPKFLRL